MREGAQLEPAQGLGVGALEAVAHHHVLVVAAGRLGMIVGVAVVVIAPALRPGRLDLHLPDRAAGLGAEGEHRLAVEQAALGVGEHGALRLVLRCMLEADEVVEWRDQLDLEHAALQRDGEIRDAVLVSAMRMLCERGGRKGEGEEAGEEG